MTTDRPQSTEEGKFRHDLNNHLSALIGELDLARIGLELNDPLRERLAQVLETAARLVSILDRNGMRRLRARRVREALHRIDELLHRFLGSTPFEYEAVGSEAQPGVPAAPGQLELLLLSLVAAGRSLQGTDRPLVLLSGFTKNEVDAPRRFALRIQHDGGDRRTIRPGPYELKIHDAAEATRIAPGCLAAFAVVEDLGGSLHHDVATGQDSTLTAYLPGATTAERRPAAGPAESRRGRRRTVMVVDDDRLVRNFIRQALEKAGFGVVGAGAATEALGLVEGLDRRVDLLIIDLVLPGMHGGLLGPQLAEALHHPPMLYMSGYDDEAIRHHRLLTPGTPFLRKPFDRAALVARVSSLLADPSERADRGATQGPPDGL